MFNFIRNMFDNEYKELKIFRLIADEIDKLDEDMSKLSDKELQDKTLEFKERLKNGETLEDILVPAFAVAREAAYRVVKMKPFYCQLLGGLAIHYGNIAEMKTGEGKTLTCVLPAYLNALTGEGVHIVTVNEFLASRDAEWMGKVHEFLGLKVGVILNDMEKPARQEAYACDITYATNNELGFDYLRDNMVVYEKDMVQRGLNFAIIDEVDSVLIDEARTPLIISGQSDKSTKLYELADGFVKSLKKGRLLNEDEALNPLIREELKEEGDFVVDEKLKTCTLTQQGVEKAERFFAIDNLSDPQNMEIQHHINNALKANNTMALDKDYVVKDGEVIIKKYSPLGELGTFAQQYVDSISQILGCPVCVADRDQIIAVAGMPKKDLVGKAIHKDLEEVINDRENIIARHGDTRYVNITSDDTAYAGQVIQTIICEGDAIGAVIVLSKDDKMRFGETEQKTAIIAANFLGKQMEN